MRYESDVLYYKFLKPSENFNGWGTLSSIKWQDRKNKKNLHI